MVFKYVREIVRVCRFCGSFLIFSQFSILNKKWWQYGYRYTLYSTRRSPLLDVDRLSWSKLNLLKLIRSWLKSSLFRSKKLLPELWVAEFSFSYRVNRTRKSSLTLMFILCEMWEGLVNDLIRQDERLATIPWTSFAAMLLIQYGPRVSKNPVFAVCRPSPSRRRRSPFENVRTQAVWELSKMLFTFILRRLNWVYFWLLFISTV